MKYKTIGHLFEWKKHHFNCTQKNECTKDVICCSPKVQQTHRASIHDPLYVYSTY